MKRSTAKGSTSASPDTTTKKRIARLGGRFARSRSFAVSNRIRGGERNQSAPHSNHFGRGLPNEEVWERPFPCWWLQGEVENKSGKISLTRAEACAACAGTNRQQQTEGGHESVLVPCLPFARHKENQKGQYNTHKDQKPGPSGASSSSS